MANIEAGFQGLLDVLKRYPNIEVVGKYDDRANVELAARITSDLISAHPDIAGICGFDSNQDLAVREAGKARKIKITTVDWESEHLQLVRDGVIQMLAGQKRELFTWYGAQFLMIWSIAQTDCLKMTIARALQASRHHIKDRTHQNHFPRM